MQSSKTPGVTRDRIYAEAGVERPAVYFSRYGRNRAEYQRRNTVSNKAQAQIAIDTAQVIILVTDIREGMTSNDKEVAGMLQKAGNRCWPAIMRYPGEPPFKFMIFII